ncbi:6-phosphofructokinase [Deferribacterales bacterium Es71-Z0220]|uniref:6-phosphofructokinase n=1 Tax=Deferrivibrio essentukiensis TaxID=2880922 RepID=UPI001F616E92|nr:6-phosphofructokinase [Deferrivibrio essentukiensis]MCB4204230.1 6-phosphofructokinase [Deferrivibrio essentukiensis]
MKRIALLTSGGDCPGMNAAIRSIVRTCLSMNIQAFGVEQGYKGLIEGKLFSMESKNVANIIQRGGTILRSARSEQFKTKQGRDIAVEVLKKNKIDGLIVVGGDGSLTGANILYKDYGVKVVGLPGSIDNDIYGTDMAIGVDTALNTILKCIDTINDTASSHDRTFLIEVMGRNCGYLALMSAIAGGAEAVLIPEIPYDIEGIIKKIKKRYEEGKTRSIIVVAEGVGSAYDFGKVFGMIGGFDTRITVLGHIQRGGCPTIFDRILATRLGTAAVEALVSGSSGVMMGLQKTQVVQVPFEEVFGNKKRIDSKLLEIAEILSR